VEMSLNRRSFRERERNVNNKVDLKTRLRFRDWLRNELKELEFYQSRGDHYLIREFANYCLEMNAPGIDEASIGRYVRDDEPVLPTPERCRVLAWVFGIPEAVVLGQAGYLELNEAQDISNILQAIGSVADNPGFLALIAQYAREHRLPEETRKARNKALLQDVDGSDSADEDPSSE